MELSRKKQYTDFLLIDCEGEILFSDIGAVRFFRKDRESLTGLNIRDILREVPDDFPLLEAARTGRVIKDFQTSVRTALGMEILITGDAFPIYRSGEPFAAFQFSEIIHDRKSVSRIQDSAHNVIYLANHTKYILGDIVTQDPAMLAVKELIPEYGMSNSNILIYGETGTGKELVAESLHNCSNRYAAPFVSLNCGAIPGQLLEGILFGTTRGSYTGAEDRPGLFEQADGGTLFLDEINSMPLDLQVKILRAVEKKRIRRVGSAEERDVDVRILSATNEDPHQLLKEQRLKPDLYYRLAVLSIVVPPLSARPGDVELLSRYFIDLFNRKTQSNIGYPDEEAMRILRAYSWPGNVRELRNVMESAFALCEEDTIGAGDIPEYIKDHAGERLPLRTDVMPLTLRERMDILEQHVIDEQLRRDDGNLTEAAAHLGMSKQRLWYRINRKGGLK